MNRERVRIVPTSGGASSALPLGYQLGGKMALAMLGRLTAPEPTILTLSSALADTDWTWQYFAFERKQLGHQRMEPLSNRGKGAP